MWSYEPPLRDMHFVFDELLHTRADWAKMAGFSHLDADTVQQVLEECGRFAAQTLSSLNAIGDLQGCGYDQGRVTTPEGFVDAYRLFCEAGWPSLSCDPALGGQGLPQILNAACYEMLFSANHAWAMYPALAHGAYAMLRAHASAHVQSAYLPSIVSGKWLTTMCLTEPQAGSDVGLIRTRAEPRAGGGYSLRGSKIFISGGEHDLTDNIIHLVLARLPDAPPGTKGISLFLVPKFLVTESGLRPNRVKCDGIEDKMGLKGSATCSMSFDDAEAFIVGEPHRGLAAMFVMMNSARLYVGLQGLGHAEIAGQNALRYALDRRQMRAIGRGPGHNPGSAADPIAVQPAVRRNLLSLRAFVEGERALGYWCAHLLDVAEYHEDGERRREASERVSLLTPVIKCLFTENGFTLSSAALQVWGGYGYIRGYGIEQTVRDSRVAMIYEGTNEIQAIDFLIRKLIGGQTSGFVGLLDWVYAEAVHCETVPGCEKFAAPLRSMHEGLAGVTDSLKADSADLREHAYRIASDFLRATGLLLLAGMWARAARISVPRLSEAFYQAKLDTAQFYFDYLLPEAALRIELIRTRGNALPSIN